MKLEEGEGEDGENVLLVVSLMQKWRRQARVTLKVTSDLENAIGFDLVKVLF